MKAERFLESYKNRKNFDSHKYCFKIVVLDNEFDDTGRILTMPSTTPVQATIYYSTKDRKDVVPFESEKNIQGQIFFRESALCKQWVKDTD